jgi:hypothetical protein
VKIAVLRKGRASLEFIEVAAHAQRYLQGKGKEMKHHVLKGFESIETHHCVTGSMRHIYCFNNHPLSEEMLLGLGGGVGFVYWHMKGTDPFRAVVGKDVPAKDLNVVPVNGLVYRLMNSRPLVLEKLKTLS